MNKVRLGHNEYAVLMWILGIFPIIMMIGMGMPDTYVVLAIFSIMMTGISTSWLPYLVSKYRLRPCIDRCKENETTWCRVTKDHILVPQFVDKGPYGQTKGVTFKEKADVVDDGSFPVKWLNGNPGIIMYDLINTSVDLNKSVARKKMTERFGIRSGIEGYKKAQEDGMVIKKHEY
jgi:hypothetical protein